LQRALERRSHTRAISPVFRVWGLGLEVYGGGFRVSRAYGVRFRVQGSGLRVLERALERRAHTPAISPVEFVCISDNQGQMLALASR